jgi:DNA-directed RNA polymerase subunit M/transcription elongation factor TFIIS
MSKEFYGFDDDDFKIEGETHVKPWQPITWENRRPDHLAWRYVDDGIEVLAYNYSFGENLQAFYLERAPSLEAIGVQPKGEPQAEPTEHCPNCGYTKRRGEMSQIQIPDDPKNKPVICRCGADLMTIPFEDLQWHDLCASQWICKKCGYGSEMHGIPGHASYNCVAEMAPVEQPAVVVPGAAAPQEGE